MTKPWFWKYWIMGNKGLVMDCKLNNFQIHNVFNFLFYFSNPNSNIISLMRNKQRMVLVWLVKN